MPCAPRGISHGRNAMARCLEAGKQATSPSHGHLDMAWVHSLVWGRHTDALDAWSNGWSTLPGLEGLDQRHADGHPVTRGALRGRGRLVRGTHQQLGEQDLKEMAVQLAQTTSDQVKSSLTCNWLRDDGWCKWVACAGHYLGGGWLCRAVESSSGQLHNHLVGSKI